MQGSKFSPLAMASDFFFPRQIDEATSKFFPNVWETWLILTRKRLPVDIFLTRSLKLISSLVDV